MSNLDANHLYMPNCPQAYCKGTRDSGLSLPEDKLGGRKLDNFVP